MSTPPAGWYDDPHDPAQQRYWDGGRWGDQRRPRQPQGVQHGQAYQGAAPYQGQQQFQQQPGYGYPPGYGQLVVAATPDGVPLSGWWNRVGARILDTLIVTAVSLPLTGYFWYRYVQEIFDFQRKAMDDALAGRQTMTLVLPWDAYKWAIVLTLIGLVVTTAYECYFLTRTGATPGKKIVGISVRLRDHPGPPPVSAVIRRWGLVAVLSLLAGIPLVGGLLGLVILLDELWPLWDSRKQALHDKFAATNVVLGPQQRR